MKSSENSGGSYLVDDKQIGEGCVGASSICKSLHTCDVNAPFLKRLPNGDETSRNTNLHAAIQG